MAENSAGQGGRAPAADYIIVGAGSAGCVVANRLTADPNTRVLLLEAGGPPSVDPSIVTPGRWVTLLGTSVDWGYATESEAGLGGRALAFPRGRIAGGSSAINAMTYIRGHRLDFDGWRRLGLAGWGYDEVLPVFRSNEDNSRGASEYRGAGGPLRVADGADPHAGHAAFLEAAQSNGFRADPSWDFFLQNGMAAFQPARDHRGVSTVNHVEPVEWIHPDLQRVDVARVVRGGPNRPRAEPRAGPMAHAIVKRGTQDHDIWSPGRERIGVDHQRQLLEGRAAHVGRKVEVVPLVQEVSAVQGSRVVLAATGQSVVHGIWASHRGRRRGAELARRALRS
jgi:choline dehydrogenase-like flavoprotein